MLTTEQDVAQFIVSTVAANPNIRGASLGAKVKRKFPGVILGKLTEFINQHCANTVVAVDQKNLDYIWALRPDNNNAPPPTSSAPPPTSSALSSSATSLNVSEAVEKPGGLNFDLTNLSAWKAFTRSDTPGKIAVNPSIAQIIVVRTSEQILPPFIEIPSVSLTEYQNIALEFVNQMTEPDRQYFKGVVESASFENQWFENITTWQDGRYAKSWGTFRFDALCSIFIKRLAAKGVAEDLSRPCLANLKRIKAKVSREKEAPLIATYNSRTQSGEYNISIHDIVANATKSLNEDDLRRVWLPVGVVLDAIKKK